ncbi:unnamed protein product [Effrenium voratum]|nr:unnamed protein product [Effrenium voratum]
MFTISSKSARNLDKAMGIAVSRARESGLPVRHVYLHMDDGETESVFRGPWSEYPFLSQHQLSTESIACMQKLETSDSGRVEECYLLTAWLRELLEDS